MASTMAPRRALFVPRLYVGVVFFAAGTAQLFGAPGWVKPGQTWPESLAGLLTGWSAHSFGFYHGILTSWIIPRAAAIAPVVAIANIVIGSALIAGAYVRVAAGLGIFLLANTLAARGQLPIYESAAALFLSLSLALALGNAGLLAGLDGLLATRAGATPEQRAWMPRWVVVPLRIHLGLALLDPGNIKLGRNWQGWVDWMPGFIRDQLPGSTRWYHPVLTHFALEHATLVAGIVAVAEPVIGSAMVLGIATRLFGAIGFLLTANYFLLNGQKVWDVSNDLALCVGFGTVAVLAGGRVFGVDVWLSRRWPNARIW